MSKLDVMRDNIRRFRAQRAASKLKSSDILTHTPSEHSSIAERVMAPPQDLVTDYYMEAHEFAKQYIYGDSTFTAEQHREMLEQHLLDRWHSFTACESLGCSNRRSYWKPSVKFENGALKIYLATKLVMTLS